MIDWAAVVIGPCEAVFGEDLKPVYTRKSGGAPFPISGVFDDAYLGLVMNPQEGVAEVATIEPVIGVSLAQFSAVAPGTAPLQGDRLTVTRLGKSYVVANVEPDGKGWALLRLNLVAP